MYPTQFLGTLGLLGDHIALRYGLQYFHMIGFFYIKYLVIHFFQKQKKIEASKADQILFVCVRTNESFIINCLRTLNFRLFVSFKPILTKSQSASKEGDFLWFLLK